jgi:hypothetical protein
MVSVYIVNKKQQCNEMTFTKHKDETKHSRPYNEKVWYTVFHIHALSYVIHWHRSNFMFVLCFR